MPSINYAEQLLDLARAIKVPRDQLVVIPEPQEHYAARVKLALDFDALPSQTKFRAVVEGWGYMDIVREVY